MIFCKKCKFLKILKIKGVENKLCFADNPSLLTLRGLLSLEVNEYLFRENEILNYNPVYRISFGHFCYYHLEENKPKSCCFKMERDMLQ